MKLLIVDDEINIREGLKEGIDWAELGFDEVLTCANGVDAISVCISQKPEIIIADIRMPGIDGIEMTRRVREMYAPVRVIILSGYSEFSYAHEAIRLGVYDYQLKPVNIDDLIRCVQGAQNDLLKEIEQLNTISDYALDRKRSELRHAVISAEGDIEPLLRDIIAEPLPEKYTLGLIRADDSQTEHTKEFIYIESYISANILADTGCILFSDASQICFILYPSVASSAAEILRIMKVLNGNLHAQFDLTVSIALVPAQRGEKLSSEYAACAELFGHRLYMGAAQLLTPELCHAGSRSPYFFQDDQGLKTFVSAMDYAGASRLIQNTFAAMLEQKVSAVQNVREICMHLKSLLFSTLKEQGIDVTALTSENQSLVERVPACCVLEDYYEWVDGLYYVVLEGLSQSNARSYGVIVRRAMDFIRTHYTENLTLDGVADYVGKSRNYFGYLFHKETGATFTEYLNGIRVEKAKELLRDGTQLTYEVAESVGFNDYKYFSVVFRKYAGMTPTEYKNRHPGGK